MFWYCYDTQNNFTEKLESFGEAQAWGWLKKASEMARVEIKDQEDTTIFKMYKAETEKISYLRFKELIEEKKEQIKTVQLF